MHINEFAIQNPRQIRIPEIFRTSIKNLNFDNKQMKFEPVVRKFKKIIYYQNTGLSDMIVLKLSDMQICICTFLAYLFDNI